MLQHIPDQIGDNHHDQSASNIPPFSPVIPVKIQANSALGAMVGGGKLFYSSLYTASTPPVSTIGVTENSFHHQAIDPDKLGNGLRISATSDEYTLAGKKNNLVEAIEPDPNGALKDWPMAAVQWHPEFGASNISAKIIQASVERAAEYAKISSRDRSRDEVNAVAETIKSSQAPLQPSSAAPTPPPATLPKSAEQGASTAQPASPTK